MDGWVRVLRPFNSISVISRRWEGEHERLCAMKRRLGSGRISPPAGFEPTTPWSEVGSANCSATRMLPERLFAERLFSDYRAQLWPMTSCIINASNRREPANCSIKSFLYRTTFGYDHLQLAVNTENDRKFASSKRKCDCHVSVCHFLLKQ